MWIAWCGFLPEFESDEANIMSFHFLEENAKKLGYETLRIYNDSIADKKVNKSLEKYATLKEEYTNEKDMYYHVGKTIIYSKSLTDKPVQKWNNKSLYLEFHENINNDDVNINDIKLDSNKVTVAKVTKENARTAIKLQQSIFPLENGKQDILSAVNNDYAENYKTMSYIMAMYEGKYIGICGLYTYNEYPNDAWVAWFGILPEYRRKGVGSILIKYVIEQAKKEKYKTLRVYTDSNINHYACKLYDKYFDINEKYLNEKGEYYQVGDTLIYSKSLTKKPAELWADKSLFLKEHEDRNQSMLLDFVPINKKNLKIASWVQYTIFNESHCCGYLDYKTEVENREKNKLPLNFLVYYKKIPVGVIGLYEVDSESEDIWLNWFGVLPEYRQHGFGTQMLLYVLELAKKYNKSYFRLFTYATWHSKSQNIYKRTMPLVENYYNENDNMYCIKNGQPKIFSINLKDIPVKKWQNKFIDLSAEILLHSESIDKLKEDGLFEDFTKYKAKKI